MTKPTYIGGGPPRRSYKKERNIFSNKRASRRGDYGYVSSGALRSSLSRRPPSWLPAFIGTAVVLVLLAAIVGGAALWNYRAFTNAAAERDGARITLAYRNGVSSRVPGSSLFFLWMATAYVNNDYSRAANAEPDSGAIEAFAQTYQNAEVIVDEVIVPRTLRAVEQYRDLLIDESTAGAYMAIGYATAPDNEIIQEAKRLFDTLEASRWAFAEAQRIAKEPYGADEAADLFEEVAEIDEENYAIAREQIPLLRQQAAEEMMVWMLPIKHFTVNPLLAFPHKAALDYGLDYITATEFKRILEQLHANNYILVDMTRLFTVNKSGEVFRRELKIPRDKTPIILSVENMTYSPRMQNNGIVDKLILDDEGHIGTWTIAGHAGANADVTSYDNDVVPILEAFIEENPDFSWRGARATLSVTGIGGHFGYRSQTGDEHEVAAVTELAHALKSRGYTFASLGYSYESFAWMTAEQVTHEMQLWQDRTASLVGETPLFFWPFGDALPQDSLGAEIMRDVFGFRSFSALGPNSYEEYLPFARLDERSFLNGRTLMNFPGRYEGFFDAETVLDMEGRNTMLGWLYY
ncbi:MAG: hypothetical protein FWG78_04085 [Coriobacteriia bacterium]|nr:hypothetical protein [Coriobacteriia bacterium]